MLDDELEDDCDDVDGDDIDSDDDGSSDPCVIDEGGGRVTDSAVERGTRCLKILSRALSLKPPAGVVMVAPPFVLMEMMSARLLIGNIPMPYMVKDKTYSPPTTSVIVCGTEYFSREELNCFTHW